jgi:hypothetical protein
MSSEATLHSETRGFCRNCGTPLTAETLRDVGGTLYCEPCLARLVTQPAQPQAAAGAGNPVLAAIMGVIPGLGAVYNSEYAKALIHFLIFVGLVTTANHGGPQPLTGLMIAGLFVYMPVEAYLTARAKMYGLKPPSPLGGWESRIPIGPILLIGFGVLLLLDKFNVLDFDRLSEYFLPILLIVGGVLWMLRRRAENGTSTEASSHE